MSAQALSNVLNTSLNGASAKTAGKDSGTSAMFESAYANQMKARQNSPVQNPDQSADMGADSQSSHADGTQSSQQGQQSQSASQSNDSQQAKNDQQADEGKQADANQQAHGAQQDGGKKTTQPGKDKPKAAAQGDDTSADGGAAAAAAALQTYVNRGLDTAQALADASGNKAVKSEGLAQALIDNSGSNATQGQTDGKDALGGKVSLSPLETGRQLLPQLAAAADPKQAASLGTSFQAELKQQLDAAADGSANAAARQPIALSGMGQRVESGRSSATADSRASTDNTIFQAVGADGWDSSLGHKVVMMVSNQQQEVELQLNPPHLGPMDVKLTLDQGQANVTFVVAHAPVREAVEASLPRLNQMLAESGIQLSQANVQARSQDSGGGQQDNRQRGSRARQDKIGAVDAAAPTSQWKARAVSGLPGNVNLFV